MNDLPIIKILNDKLQNKNVQLFLSIIILVSVTAVLGAIMNTDSKNQRKANQSEKNEVTEGIDTYIPKGHILIPIEILNKEALKGILEGKGVVNLYSAKKRKIAQNVKVIQAPLNREVFAVLVRENEAGPILENASGVFVTINSGKIDETGSVFTEKKSSTEVNFGG